MPVCTIGEAELRSPCTITMPVSRQKAEDPSEIVDAPPLNVETLEYTVSQFKKHHEDCALRRKNGISYEIHAEQQRTELLKRKYFDNLRQQQALSGRIEEPRVKEQAGGPFEADHIFVSVRVCDNVCCQFSQLEVVCVFV